MKKLFAFLFILGLSSTGYTATPTITALSGTVLTGQTITITGTNMVNEDKTNWGTAYKTGTKYGFEGTSFLSDGYAVAPDSNRQESGYDSTVKIMGKQSYKGRIYGNSDGSSYLTNYSAGLLNHADGLASDGVGSTTDIYVRMYSKWHSVGNRWPTSHIKMLDVEGPSGTQMYFQPSATSGSSLPTTMNMTYDSAPHNYSVKNFLEDNRWYCIEARFKSSSPRNFTTWVDGVQVASVTPADSLVMNWVAFNIINANEFTNLDVTNWTDGFTISSSRIYPAAIIEVSNNATYGAGTIVQQEPVYLSDTSIQVKLNIAGLGSGPYYMWITNNMQERSAVYNLSSGQSVTDTQAPTTPASLTATSNSSSQINLSWSAATDNILVTGYKVYRNGAYLTTVTDTTYSNTGLTASTSYSYTVSAIDAAGNESSQSTTASATTPSDAANTTPTTSTTGTQLFAESFDDNNLAARSWFDDTTVDIDTSTKHTGTGSLRLTWAAGGTNPPLVGAMRKSFTPTDHLYISQYWRFNSNWVGSGQSYHPHLVMILSDLDDVWGSLAMNYLDTYIETSNLTPRVEIQDGLNVNASYGTPPNNLTSTTQSRDVSGCNGTLVGSDAGSTSCYSYGGYYYNGRLWNGSSNFNLNTWHHVETYFVMNSISNGVAIADGVMKMWVDGNLVINNTHMVYRTNAHPTLKWATFIIAPWIGDGSPQAQTMWIDDLVVSTATPSSTAADVPGSLSVKSVSPN